MDWESLVLAVLRFIMGSSIVAFSVFLTWFGIVLFDESIDSIGIAWTVIVYIIMFCVMIFFLCTGSVLILLSIVGYLDDYYESRRAHPLPAPPCQAAPQPRDPDEVSLSVEPILIERPPPVVRVREHEHEIVGGICPVCFEEYEHLAFLPCSHILCLHCADNTVERRCPFCRDVYVRVFV